jgi:hypothetical protein
MYPAARAPALSHLADLGAHFLRRCRFLAIFAAASKNAAASVPGVRDRKPGGIGIHKSSH